MVTSELRQWNEEMAHKYDPDLFHRHPNLLVRYIERKRVRTIIKRLEVGSGERVMDVGCGAGNILAELPQARAVGLDLSSYLLAKARARLHDTAFLVRGDVEGLPFADSFFDKAYCSEVLEHLPSPQRALEEIARVMKAGGRVILSIPNEGLIDRIKTLLVRLRLFGLLLAGRNVQGYHSPVRMEDEWHISPLDLQTLRALARDTLVFERIEGIPFFLLPLRYVVTCRVKK